MKRKKYRLAIAIIFCFFIFIVNCQNKENNKAIATVNGEIITVTEFVNALPTGFASDSVEQNYRQSLIDNLIVKKLFMQAAKKQGLDQEIQPILERDKKSMMIRALYDDVVTKNLKISRRKLRQAKSLLAQEVHLKLIITNDKESADKAYQELKRGLSFDSVVKIYSVGPNIDSGGDVGYIPVLYLEPILQKAVMKMAIGEFSTPLACEEDYKIIQLVGKQKSDLDKATIHKNAKMFLEQNKSRELANNYLDKLFKRLQYNPEGLALFYKPVDSISVEEGEIWVCKKDDKKVVYAKNLLYIARQFPVQLDTAMRNYAIRREIEDDLLYEDALTRGLDKKGNFEKELKAREDDLLYEKYYLTEITQKIDVTSKEIEQYYNTNRDKYPNMKLQDASSFIRQTLLMDKKQARYQIVAESLKANATLEVNHALVKSVKKPQSKRK